MKQLTELKDGQKVLIAFDVIKQDGYYEFTPSNSIDFVLPVNFKNNLNIYDFDEVMNLSEKSTSSKSEPISKEEFDKKMDEFWNKGMWFNFTELKKYVYDLFKSYHPESFTPEVNKEYEFSDNGINWYRYKLHSFYTLDKNMIYGNFYYIRHIQQSEEEIKFLELAEKFKDKYEVNKK